jgi:hypothetical protein
LHGSSLSWRNDAHNLKDVILLPMQARRPNTQYYRLAGVHSDTHPLVRFVNGTPRLIQPVHEREDVVLEPGDSVLTVWSRGRDVLVALTEVGSDGEAYMAVQNAEYGNTYTVCCRRTSVDAGASGYRDGYCGFGHAPIRWWLPNHKLELRLTSTIRVCAAT